MSKSRLQELPDLDPKETLVYTTVELIKALRISNDTFYRHREKLGLQGRRKYCSNALWYSHDDAMAFFCSIYQPLDVIRLAVGLNRR